MEEIVPGDFELSRERRVVPAHPGNLIQQNNFRPFAFQFRVKCTKGLGPALQRRNRMSALGGKLIAKGLQLFGIRHPFIGSEALKLQVQSAAFPREFLNQRGLADSATSAAHDQRGDGLPPERH